MNTNNRGIPILTEELTLLHEIANAISTENADPVWACAEPGVGPLDYLLPTGASFSLAPIVSSDTFDAFMTLLADLEVRAMAIGANGD